MRLSIVSIFIFTGSLFSFKALGFGIGKSGIDSITVTDTTSVDDAKTIRKRYIDVSVEYGSNFTYRHQIDQTAAADPYVYPTLYYKDKTGFWGSVGAYRLLNNYVEKTSDTSQTSIAPNWIEADFSLGWGGFRNFLGENRILKRRCSGKISNGVSNRHT